MPRKWSWASNSDTERHCSCRSMMSVSQCALLHEWQHDCWKSSWCCSAFSFLILPLSPILSPWCLCFCVCVPFFREQLLISWNNYLTDISVTENDAAFVLLHHNFRWWKSPSPLLPAATISSCDTSTSWKQAEQATKGNWFIVKWIWIRLPRSAVNEIKYLRSVHIHKQSFAFVHPFPYQFIKRANMQKWHINPHTHQQRNDPIE